MLTIDQQQQTQQNALTKQTYDQVSNSFEQVTAKFIEGKETMKSAWQDFANSFDQAIDQMVAKLATQALFGGGGSGAGLLGLGASAAFGGSSGGSGSIVGTGSGGLISLFSGLFGSSGGAGAGGAGIDAAAAAADGGQLSWMSLISGMFGGGLAQGGYAAPNTMYEVAENGPEMLSVGGKSFVLMGSQGGNVIPSGSAAGGGSSMNVTNNFHMGQSTDTRTQSQIAAAGMRSMNMVNARNN
jgi:hypothetical protein